MFALALSFAVAAAPTQLNVAPVKVLERFVPAIASLRCDRGTADAGVALLEPTWADGKVTWQPAFATHCSASPAALTFALGMAVSWVNAADPTADAPVPAFQPTDVTPALARLKIKPVMQDGFNTYTPKELERIWASLYVAPSTQLLGVTAQTLYDTLFKASATEAVDTLVWLETSLDQKARKELLADYRKKVADSRGKPDTFFVNLWLGEQLSHRFTNDLHPFRAGPLLGVMLRRTADGTWPTARGLFVKTLEAYDPPLARQLQTH